MLDQLWNDLWIVLFIVLVVIGFFSGQALVIGFGVMGLAVGGISWLWNRVSLERVLYERHLPQQRAFIGEEVPMSITVTNMKPVPLAHLKIEDAVPDAIEIADADVVASSRPNSHTMRHLTSMSWYERVRWDYRMTCSERGLFHIGPARLSGGDLFGFHTSEKTVSDLDYLLVYPRVVPLPELGLPASKPLGDIGGGIRIFQDPSRPSGVRDYMQGDPLNIVDWKASARAQKLRVRSFEPSSTISVVLVVVVETTARYWEGYSPINLERVVTVAASVASYAAENRYSLGLFSDGTPILADRPMKIPPNGSPEQLSVILEALATIRPLAAGPMAAQLAEHAQRFPMGATLAVVTAFMPSELMEIIIDLNTRAYRMVVLYVGDGQCPEFPGDILVHELQDYFARMEQASEFGPG